MARPFSWSAARPSGTTSLREKEIVVWQIFMVLHDGITDLIPSEIWSFLKALRSEDKQTQQCITMRF